MPRSHTIRSLIPLLLLASLTSSDAQRNNPGVRIDEHTATFSACADGFDFDIELNAPSIADASIITVELLDPLGGTRASGVGQCRQQPSGAVCHASLPPALPSSNHAYPDGDELALYRLRYTISTAGQAPRTDILALSHIAPELYELHVASLTNLRPGVQYSARVRAIHPLTRTPQAGVALDAVVSATSSDNGDDDEPVSHASVVTDADGFASIPFTLPAGSNASSVDLDLTGHFGNFQLSTTQTLRVASASRFSLATDKPLYQPGQTVHQRLLLLGKDGHAVAAQTIQVDISDPNDTLVHRATAVTSAFGIATTDWAIPSHTRLGSYSLRATLPDDSSQSTQALTNVRISRYDLPTFVVQPHPDRQVYLPGTNANVDVRATYLFGKPVRRGHVRIVQDEDRTWDFANQRWDTKEGKTFNGQLDARGVFHAHIDLHAEEKQYLSRRPSNAFEDVHFAAYVTDASTGLTEQRRFDLRVANQALNIYLISPPQAEGLAQEHFVSVSTADGTPAPATVTVALLPPESDKETSAHRLARAATLLVLHTDAHGLASLSLPAYEALQKQRPAIARGDAADVGDSPELLLIARDATGRSGGIVQALSAPETLLRVTADHAIYHPGERIELTLESSHKALPITVQLSRMTRRGEVPLSTLTTSMANGRAELSINTDARYAGVIIVHAIAVGTESSPSTGYRYDEEDDATHQATRALLFPHDSRLQVGVRMSQATYAPGIEAIASLNVKGPQDPDGDDPRPAPAALGLVAIDQAVVERERTDSDFGGTSSSFLRLADDTSASAGGFTADSISRLNPNQPFPEGAQLAAAVLLAGIRSPIDSTNDTSTQDLASAFRVALDGTLREVRLALAEYLRDHTELPTAKPQVDALLARKNLSLDSLRDPWGRPFVLGVENQSDGTASLNLTSSGPDKQPGTADDFSVNLASWHWFAGRQKELQRAIDLHHARTGHFIRTEGVLASELKTKGISIASWRDPWGQPLQYRFSVEQTRFVLQVETQGNPAAAPAIHYPYTIGRASIDYTRDLQRHMDTAMSSWASSHGLPTTQAEYDAALRFAHINAAELVDPWHHPLQASFRSHSFFTDLAHTEAHAAAPGEQPQLRTTYTPVTETADIIDLRSNGPDGRRGTADDFTLITISRVRTTQSAAQPHPVEATQRAVHLGVGGDVSGKVTDLTGATIPRATIVATEIRSQRRFETTTDETGRYVLGPLPSGTYTLRFAAAGFNDLIYDQVVVRSTGITAVDATLYVGTVSQAVEVTASAPVLETSSASVVSVQAITNLPLSPRSATSLTRIAPGVSSTSQPATTPRLRDYFPETLLWRPEIITAADGTTTVHFPVADNLTTWKLSAVASTMMGNTGEGSTSFTTFQPFFIDFNPPSILTVGDHLHLPVTLRNYLDHPISATATLKLQPWFHIDGAVSTRVSIGSQQSASPTFRFTALSSVENGTLEITGQGDGAGDRIARQVTVHPDGLQATATSAVILTPGQKTLRITLPSDVLPDGARATLKIYPNLGAHLRDALAAMATYPNGCAEQITSTAWPSLLLQRYSASLPHRDDKLQQQTRAHLEEAYQNLLANQLPSGGFSYWSRSTESDLALTAYVVEFLQQSSEFITIDPSVIQKAIAWLAREQEKDGQWQTLDGHRKKQPMDRRGNAMLTSSIAFMISGAPGAEPLVGKALAATQPFVTEFGEPYTLANYALAAIAIKDSDRSSPAIARLRTMALSEDGGAYWSLETNSPFFGWGRAGRVESTAQVLRALIRSGTPADEDLITRGMLFLNHQRDRQSLWYSTQATARVLDVIAEAALRSSGPASTGGPATLALAVDGLAQAPIDLPAPDVDSGPIFLPLPAAQRPGAHTLTLTLPPSASSATAQWVTNFYRPWTAAARETGVTNHERLVLDVHYSTAHPAVGASVSVAAHVERIGFRGYGMLLAEIGLPPGADVDRFSLEATMNASGYQINQYEILPDRVVLYLSPRAGGVDVKFSFRLRYAIDAMAAPSTVYDYYNPDARMDLHPTHMQSR